MRDAPLRRGHGRRGRLGLGNRATRNLRCCEWSGVTQQVEQRGHARVRGCGCDRRRVRGCGIGAFHARPIGHRRRQRGRLRLFLSDQHAACERRRPVSGIPDHRRREFQEGEGVRPAGIAGDDCLPDRLAIRRRLHDAVILQHVEDRRIARRDAVDALRQQVCAQLVGDGLAHQPQGVLGQPAVRRAGLVQLELFLDQVAQAFEQFALQRMLGRRQRPAGITAELLGDRCLVGLHDQFAKRAGVLVLAGQHVQQRGPEIGISR